jgi:hypothetical protein
MRAQLMTPPDFVGDSASGLESAIAKIELDKCYPAMTAHFQITVVA